jgi:hypothetical protein
LPADLKAFLPPINLNHNSDAVKRRLPPHFRNYGKTLGLQQRLI